MATKYDEITLSDIAKSIGSMQAQINCMQEQMATKDDLARSIAAAETRLEAKMVLKDDFDKAISGLVSKEDFDITIAKLVTKDDFDSVIATLVGKDDFDNSISKLVNKNDFDNTVTKLVTKDDFDNSISRLEATIRREAGDLGESIASLTNMAASEFDSLAVTRLKPVRPIRPGHIKTARPRAAEGD